MKPEAGVTLDVGRHLSPSDRQDPWHSGQSLLHGHHAEVDHGAGDDDHQQPEVEGDAGAVVLLLRLITILEMRMRTTPSLAGAVEEAS